MVYITAITSVLKCKDGKFVTVRKNSGRLKLCAVELQTAPSVSILRDENRMAFQFQRGQNNYLLQWNQKTLRLDLVSEVTNLESTSYWFEKENLGNGEHYGLRCVGKPRRYVALAPAKKRSYVFILSKARQDCVLVTDKKL